MRCPRFARGLRRPLPVAVALLVLLLPPGFAAERHEPAAPRSAPAADAGPAGEETSTHARTTRTPEEEEASPLGRLLRGEADDPSSAKGGAPGLVDAVREEHRPYWKRNLFKRVLGDQKFLVTTWWPSELHRPSFFVPLAVATAAAATSSAEDPGPDFRLERSIAGRAPGTARFFSTLGDASTAAALVGGTYLVSRWRGNTRLSRATSLSAEALLDAGIWSTLLKRVTARTRPARGGRGEFFDYAPQGGQEIDSFPSGHATGAFAVATVFAAEYRDKRWVGWVAYGLAGLIGGSRVALGRHFPSDVLAGAMLGHSLGRMVIAREEGFRERPIDRLEPIFDPLHGTYGVSYRFSW